MLIRVGSNNPIKVQAVKEICLEYPILKVAKVFSINIESIVSEQPKSLEESVIGAINRAVRAQKDFNFGFGIESGLMIVPATKSGYMDVCVCAIYDGTRYHLGLSSAFECPPAAIKLVIEKDLDLNQACYKLGITRKKKLGSEEGLIGLLTNGRVMRLDYTKQAVRNALIHLENKELYDK
jgi:inosine/xanthosine triphosphatase